VDADRRRTAAVNRLAVWSWRARRWTARYGSGHPLRRFAADRHAAARARLTRLAVRDVLAGRHVVVAWPRHRHGAAYDHAWAEAQQFYLDERWRAAYDRARVADLHANLDERGR
jgi:hypothetical protein